MNRVLHALVIAALLFTVWPALAQDGGSGESCGDALPPRLIAGGAGQVAFTDGAPLNVRLAAGLDGEQLGQLPEGSSFSVLNGPFCADGIYWWEIRAADLNGFVAEAVDGTYLIEPALAANYEFVEWDWNSFFGGDSELPDPLAIQLPVTYQGDMPSLPVSLNDVMFIENANLNQEQLAVLAQNGFVVVPAGLAQFGDAYGHSENWSAWAGSYDENEQLISPGQPNFVTTDSALHILHYIFGNLLSDLEKEAFYPQVLRITAASLDAANSQYQELKGSALETPARNAMLYLAVGFELLTPGELGGRLDADLLPQVMEVVQLARAGEGQLPLPFNPDYEEDFSQYRPRGHYAGDPLLENYFRGMMWLSRITFRAEEESETQTALLLLRALTQNPDIYREWFQFDETLAFLVGPADDLGPREYAALAGQIYGGEMPLERLGDAARLAEFQAAVKELPGPRVNGLLLPIDTEAGEEADAGRGFRFTGQRFTFDAYILQRVMMPYVGTRDNPRLLPMGLDVAAVFGSEEAYDLADEAGATSFENYPRQVETLRAEADAISPADWRENVYGTWLWALEPLFERDTAPYPPLMNTQAWARKDLQTGLASYTELKHDTVLYAKQATGFGGGGPPLLSFGLVEPNPLVFARIAAVAAITYQGLDERGYISDDYRSGVFTSANEMRGHAQRCARLADIARRELAGQPIEDSDYFFIQEYGSSLRMVIETLYQGEGEPDPVALVTDIANDGLSQVLQAAVGGVDYIYVVIPGPQGLQLSRGGVYSYYEFVGDINQRMTNEEWRGRLAGGDAPARPDWVSSFVAE
jgi:hypothetical protein